MNKYLEDVPEEKAFILGDKKIKNLYGLLFELRSMTDETYAHYVNPDHNYFSDWILHVIGNKNMADELRPITERKEEIGILEKNIESLKKGQEKKEETLLEVKKEIKEEPKKETKPFIFESKENKSEVKQENILDNKQKEKIKEEKTKEKKLPVISKEAIKETPADIKSENTANLLKKVSQDEKEIKEFLWKHFTWDMAKEFMYGLAIGILIGLILSKIFIRV